jgi:hypothetical protein
VIFKTLEDGRYVATDAEHGIEFHCDQVRRDRHGELVGFLTVACGMLGTNAIDGPLLAATFNFSNLRSRDDCARRLAQYAKTGGKFNWGGKLEALCQYVTGAELSGHSPAVVLRNAPHRTTGGEFDVLGLTFNRDHGNNLFADGGSLKSYLALHIASELARRGTRVGFFDWELDVYTHRDRYEQINGPDMPDGVIYVRCDQPLVYEKARLRRIIRHEQIRFGIFDSAGYLTDGAPEAADATMAACRAMRQLGIGHLLLAHITKGENGDRRPFGSTFWFNSARSVWFLKVANTSPDGNAVNLGAFHRKSNLGPLRPALGICVEFEGDRVQFRRTDAATIEELAESLPLWQRIRGVVKTGPQTLATIASELNHDNVESLDRIVRKHKNLFTKVSGNDGITRIALVERRAS